MAVRLSFSQKIACGTVLLLFAYTYYVKENPAYYPTHQHVGALNIIRAQKFMHDRRDLSAASVLLGSSLSQEMFKDRLDLVMRHDLINLAFASRGPFEGLELLRRKGASPRRILIEMNTIPIVLDEEFIDSIHSPIWTPVRMRWRILRLENQPVGVFVPLLYFRLQQLWLMAQPTPEPAQRAAPAPPVQQQQTVAVAQESEPAIVRTPDEERRYQKSLEIVIENASKAMDLKHYDAQLLELKSYIEYFSARGTEVILYEVPIDAQACPLLRPRTMRRYVSEQLGQAVRMIPLPDCNTYSTRDGLHLVPESLARYQLYLIQQAGVVN